MADWPDLDDIKQVLNVESDDWDTRIEAVRVAAIDKVKRDVGGWDEDTDEPDDALSQAAVRMAELMSERPTAPTQRSLGQDPSYRSLLSGHRRKFGIG